jgi:hypothetical protein
MTAARMTRSAKDAAAADVPAVAGYFGSSTSRYSARVQRAAIGVSILLHLSYLAYLQAPLFHRKPAAPPEERPHVTLVLPFDAERPRPATAEATPKLPIPTAPTEVPQILAEEPTPHSIPSADESKADATQATLRYEDPRHELPVILRRYQGYVGFGRSNESEQYVRRVFSAVTRNTIPLPDGLASLEEFSSIRIDGAGYSLVDDLRRQNRLDEFIAYALFSSVFAEEVKHTLRKAVVARFGGGKIASATVIFSAAVENGLEAGEIVLASGSH